MTGLKKILLPFILILLLCNFSFGQSSNIADLDSLYRILKKMPSFQEQIVGEKAIAYEAMYARLRKELDANLSDYEVFRKLSQLILPVNDNHVDFSQIPSISFTKENASKPDFIAAYKASAAHKRFPRSEKRLKTLEETLAGKPREDIEGIYYNYDNELKVGIYRTGKNGVLEGVVLSSAVPFWEPGQIVCYLEEKGDNRYNSWTASYTDKAFYMNRSERLANGWLLGSGFRKLPVVKAFTNISDQPNFLLKKIDTNIQYLKLNNFRVSDVNKVNSKKFYNEIKDSLTAPYLIVDLRNNGGGYYSISSPFLNLLRRYANPGKIYALVNYGTVSNAEQFTIKLKGIEGAVILGQTTMGRITYGQNYGTVQLLPSGRYRIVPTDLPGEKIDLPYEDKGVKPDILLDTSRNWIEQVMELIKSRK